MDLLVTKLVTVALEEERLVIVPCVIVVVANVEVPSTVKDPLTV